MKLLGLQIHEWLEEDIPEDEFPIKVLVPKALGKFDAVAADN